MFDLIRKLRQTEAERRDERIRAYIDQEMSSTERQAFEQQMARDDALAMEVQHQTRLVQAMRQLPLRKSPRNFTLTPDMVNAVASNPWYKQPIWRAGTALAAIVIVALLAFNLSSSGLMQPQAGDSEYVASESASPESASDAIAAMPAEIEVVVTSEVRAEVEKEMIVTVEIAREEAEMDRDFEPPVVADSADDMADQDTTTDMADEPIPEAAMTDNQADGNANVADTSPFALTSESYLYDEDNTAVPQDNFTPQVAPPRPQNTTPPNRTSEITPTIAVDEGANVGSDITSLAPTTDSNTQSNPVGTTTMPVAGIFVGVGILLILVMVVVLRRFNKL